MTKTKEFCPIHKYFDRHCMWCKAEMIMRKEMEPVPKFNTNSDTGFYIGETKVLRVPTFRDIWEMLMDWVKFRKRYFFEPGICIAVNGEEKGDQTQKNRVANQK